MSGNHFKVRAISSSPRRSRGLELIARTWNPVQSELEDLERLQILINYSGGEKGRKILKVYRNILVIFAPLAGFQIYIIEHYLLFFNPHLGIWNKSYSNSLSAIHFNPNELIHNIWNHFIFRDFSSDSEWCNGLRRRA